MKKNKTNLMISIIGVFILILTVTGVSTAYFSYNKDIAAVDLSSGSINIDFEKMDNTSSVTSNEVLSDELGKNWSTYLEFNVNGIVDTEAILYELEIIPKSGNTIDGKYIKVYLTEVENGVETPLMSPMRYIELYDSLANNGKGMYQDLMTGNNDGTSKTTNKKYRLRVWIDEDYNSVNSGSFGYGVYLYAKNVDKTNYKKVMFNFQDGRVEGLSKYVEIGQSYGNLPTPYREGYNLLGLKYDESDENYIVDSDLLVTRNDYNLKAIWSWNNYKYNDEVQEIEINGGEVHNDYITLNGTSDYIALGQINNKKEASISATVNLDSAVLTGEHEIISNDENSGMELDINDGYARFRIYLDGYNDFLTVSSNSTLDANKAHDITGTYDGKVMKLYIDGSLNNQNDITAIKSANNLSGKIKNSTNNTIMVIGGNPSGNVVSSNYFKGNIYSVRIYDYAIDELKINSNINHDGFL